jgi:hypothetical protein
MVIEVWGAWIIDQTILTSRTYRYKKWRDDSGEDERSFEKIEVVEDVEKDLEASYAEFDQFTA